MARIMILAQAAVTLLLGCQAPDKPIAPHFPTGAPAAKGSTPLAARVVALSETLIEISWNDGSPNDTSELHRSTTGASGVFTLLTTVGPGVRVYLDQGLAPSTEYCYRIRSVRVTGNRTSYSAFTTTACAVTFTPPPTLPEQVQGAWAEESSSGVLVSWIDRSTNEDGFRIERWTDGATAWETAGTVGANITSWVTDQPVCYRVVAFNAVGSAQPSPYPGCTIPIAPTNLRLTMLDNGMIELTWSDNSAIEQTYEVWLMSGSCCPGAGPCDAGVYENLIAELPANSTSWRTSGFYCTEFAVGVAATKYNPYETGIVWIELPR